MAKHAYKMRTSRPPGRNDLRSRGCPDPDRAVVYSRPPREQPASRRRSSWTAPAEQSPRAHARRVEKLEGAMVEAQAVVRDRKARGLDYSDAVTAARSARAAWLAVTGGAPERAVVEVSQGSDTNPVKAV